MSHLHQARHRQALAQADADDYRADLAARTHARDALALANLVSSRLHLNA